MVVIKVKLGILLGNRRVQRVVVDESTQQKCVDPCHAE